MADEPSEPTPAQLATLLDELDRDPTPRNARGIVDYFFDGGTAAPGQARRLRRFLASADGRRLEETSAALYRSLDTIVPTAEASVRVNRQAEPALPGRQKENRRRHPAA